MRYGIVLLMVCALCACNKDSPDNSKSKTNPASNTTSTSPANSDTSNTDVAANSPAPNSESSTDKNSNQNNDSSSAKDDINKDPTKKDEPKSTVKSNRKEKVYTKQGPVISGTDDDDDDDDNKSEPDIPSIPGMPTDNYAQRRIPNDDPDDRDYDTGYPGPGYPRDDFEHNDDGIFADD